MSVFEFSEEQKEFRQATRHFFTARSTSADVRRLMDSDLGYDPALWNQMAEQLSLQGVVVPSKYGGGSGNFVDLAIVFEEMGRMLFCSPYLATVAFAANLLLTVGDEKANAMYLPRIASGDLIATAGLLQWQRTASDYTAVTARGDGSNCVLNGSLPLVLDGHAAELVIVVARSEHGRSYYALDSGDHGYKSRLLQTADQTRKIASVELVDVRGRRIGPEGVVDSTIETVISRAAICLAAEQLGGAERCLEMAVEYAKERVQFGRAIGSFQAIKHMCANLLLDVESAKSASYFAAWQVFQPEEDLNIAASIAKVACSEAFSRVAADNIQIHGGIGYTWESDCHLLFKRAVSSEILLGTPRVHRTRIAQRLGI